MHIDLLGCSRDVLALFVVLKWSLNNCSSSCINMLILALHLYSVWCSVIFFRLSVVLSCPLLMVSELSSVLEIFSTDAVLYYHPHK